MAGKLDYTWAADALAVKACVPAALVSALINAESAWNTNAVSPTGATGLGQFTKMTAVTYGLAGDTFDNRADAALNLTACVRYLADLRKDNPTWREVIGHYSGQGTDLANYARYSAGQALIATIAMVDGVPVPPPDGTVIVIDSVSAHDQATGKPYSVVLGAEHALRQVAEQMTSAAPKSMMLGIGLATMVGLGGIAACCSPEPTASIPNCQGDAVNYYRGDGVVDCGVPAPIPAVPQQEAVTTDEIPGQVTTSYGFSCEDEACRLDPGPTLRFERSADGHLSVRWAGLGK